MASLDGGGFALPARPLGASQEWEGVLFRLGPANAPDLVTGTTVTLPPGKFGTLKILATGVEGSQKSQTFTVAYADGTSSPFPQRVRAWSSPPTFRGPPPPATLPSPPPPPAEPPARPLLPPPSPLPLASPLTPLP